nr:Shedu immune nuclease family protein [Kribbella shirazensis]
MTDRDFFDAYKARNDVKQGDEGVWQHFFDANQWIFGYGLSLISSQSFDDHRLEQITTGANLFGGAGKRIDAILRSRGFVSSLMFTEIKKPSTALLADRPYRKPDVFQPSTELTGAISQLQKTTDKAIRGIATQFYKAYGPDGEFLGFEVSTIRPKQALIIGKLEEFESNGDVNQEKSTSFELYRRSIPDIEILTFDELYERARFIVGDD